MGAITDLRSDLWGGLPTQEGGHMPLVFVTVGSQMPFDRLIQAVERWALHQPEVKVVAQIGASTLAPRAMEWVRNLDPARFDALFRRADLIVSHAGMGTVISAAERAKPLIVLPRRGSLKETRNDHQVATARWLTEKPGIRVVMDEADLAEALNRWQEILPPQAIRGVACDDLIEHIRDFISGEASERKPK
ncbi:hypothetical protein OTERR_19040 [Oryzomicrobium terrae]|uniref:Glycosyl transferase family 28 C-terminal domain-containing protein n=1 Tax=Oryzomicrobium terrae TaxID=1735038 RepID=A0A5C1E934_9RHOO|nr:glycosyltransferase [Oryzomicrobium terrae]QEL65380.1 hypothetical protein OTERR_19040 [Oryzomicrobium terrae]